MAPIRDVEVEGNTVFGAAPIMTSYRYVLKLKDDKLSIWLEDRTSKKQWYKGGMVKGDYVTSVNTISDASAIDYLWCFRDSLDGNLQESNDFNRTLEMMEGGIARLAFEVRFRVLCSMRVAKYAFLLDPLTVERIDVLESKLRDQQDELNRHCEELERLSGKIGIDHAHIELEASTKTDATSNLLWGDSRSKSFSVLSETGNVSIRRRGLYSIAAVVNATTTGVSQTVQLMKNGTNVQTAYVTNNGYCSSSTLITTARLDANDLVAVTCSCNIRQAFLSITLLVSYCA